MYWLEVSNEKKGIIGLPHPPQFAVDEEAIFVGSKTMATVLLHYLEINYYAPFFIISIPRY
jgi:hypothetical protein